MAKKNYYWLVRLKITSLDERYPWMLNKYTFRTELVTATNMVMARIKACNSFDEGVVNDWLYYAKPTRVERFRTLREALETRGSRRIKN